MVNQLNEIIDVSVSIQNARLSLRGFGIPLILGESMKLTSRIKKYNSLEGVLEDFAETDVEYKMAASMFSQQRTPEFLYIGKKVSLGSTAIVAATNPTGNIVNIQATGHNLEDNASVNVIGFNETEYNGTFQITVIDDNNYQYDAGQALPSTPATGTGSFTATETWSNAIQEIFEIQSDWYALLISSNVKADILNAAAKIEAIKRTLIVRTSDADNLDSEDTTSIMAQLAALNYQRTMVAYNADTITKFIDAAWAGYMLPTTPGSETWAFKTLVGITSDNLSFNGKSAIFANNGNTYEDFEGRDITRYGTVASGEYFDIIRGADYLVYQMQVALFLLLLNNEKVPYTIAGVNMIENTIRDCLNKRVVDGFIAADADGKGIYTVSILPVDEQEVTDKANRQLKGVTFRTQLAGAIHKITVVGTLYL